MKPGVEFISENKREKKGGKDSLLSSSLKYLEVDPYIELININGFKAGAKYSLRDDYFPLDGLMQKEARATTKYLELGYSDIKEFNTVFNLTFRNKKFTDVFKQQGRLDNQTILVRSNSKFKFWEQILNGDMFYEVSTKMSAKLEKVFVPVESRTGNYKYLGDLNGNGVPDENEFELTLFDGDFILVTIPTDKLFPVIQLKTSTRWKIKYAEIFDRKSIWGKILKPLSTETVWRVEEDTREEDFSKIYLMKLDFFQVEGKTIRGSNFFQQDIWLLYSNFIGGSDINKIYFKKIC